MSEGRQAFRLIMLFLISTVSLVLSWQSDATVFFVFLAFVPVFMIFDRQTFSYDEKVLVVILSFLFVFISAYLTTYWIRNVNPPTHFVIAMLRGFTMMLPFVAAFIFLFKIKKRKNAPVIAFVTAWLMMEVLHDLNILGMSYGNLGHVLAAYPGMIQWYAVTGTIGGTLWIFLVNYAIYLLLQPLLSSRLRFPKFGRVSGTEIGRHSKMGSGKESKVEFGRESKIESGNASKVKSGRESKIKSGKASKVKSSRELKIESGNASKVSIHRRQSSIPPKVSSRWITATALLALAAAFPVLISLIIYRAPYATSVTDINVVAVHTSMDVYDFKYEVAPEVLLENYIRTSKKELPQWNAQKFDPGKPDLQSNLNIIFWPENALTGNLFSGNLHSSEAVQMIRRNLIKETQTVVVTGAIVDQKVPAPAPGSYHPRILHNKEEDYYFRRYNAALYIRPEGPPVMKVKKRLVPLSELVPASRIFAPLVSLIPNLEDLNFSPADDSYISFGFSGGEARTSPVICYGSAFSAFTADEIKHTGSGFMAVILNEGWMKSKKAYRHFNWFAICRAVENRRFLVKSSNEGISAFIDSKGNVIEQRSGTTNDAISARLRINERRTFYTRFHKILLFGILVAGGVILTLLRYNNKNWQRKE